ncbi:MAG: TonB-dependent receptor [Porphyromonadaceae bacterium]|nr:TonB-dependent receptor [Porphyromonadaceae bacterium]
MTKRNCLRQFKASSPLWRMLTLLVLLGLKPSVATVQAQQSTAKHYTISGHVVDAESKEILIGATIYAPETKQGAYTNSYGFFSFSPSKPIRSIRISYIGYETQTIDLDLKADTTLTIELDPKGLLQEVVITEERRQLRAPQAGAIEVPVHIIKTTPALLGENDLMKALQMMPGVQSGSEGSAGVHVRGGGSDENLILLDGVSLYSVDHLFGFFSVFTPEAVKKVDLYKGNFPARFGGRLSSVIDVRTNDGNMQKYKGAFSIGLISSKAQIEGPIIKDRTSFNLAVRRTYLDLLVKPFIPTEDFNGGYYFYDINAKLQHKLGERDRLYLSLYYGLDKLYSDTNDVYNITDEDGNFHSRDVNTNANLNWGNTLASLRWNHVFSSKLYSDMTLAYTKYHFLTRIKNSVLERSTEKQFVSVGYNSGIEDLSLGWNAHYFASPRSEFRFGFDYIYHTFRPEAHERINRGEELDLGLRSDLLNAKPAHPLQAHHAALYAESKYQLNDALQINAGLRAAMFAVNSKAYLSLQPRANIDWRITPLLNMTLGYARMSQNVHLLTSAAMTLPTDLWVPATKHLKPMTSDQVSLGMNYKFGNGWYLNTEAYYKQLNHVLEYKDGASFVGSSIDWEDKVVGGEGRSYGVEAILMRQVGRTTGWVGYTLSKADRRFPDGSINRGEWFPYKYDRRHKLNIVVSHKFSERVDASASWEFYTGGVITLGYEKMQILRPDALDSWQSDTESYIPERNNFRLPATHRLNLSVSYNRFHKGKARSVWNFSIFNAYNQKNPAFILPSDLTSNSKKDNRVTKVTLLPLIPSISYTYKF